MRKLLLALVACLVLAIPAPAETLQKTTMKQWDDYVHNTELWRTKSAKDPRSYDISNLANQSTVDGWKSGKLVVWPYWGKPFIHIHEGLIHDWVGIVFIPKATIHDVIFTSRNYYGYPEMYKPTGIYAKPDSMYSEDITLPYREDIFTMVVSQKTSMVTATIDGEYDVRFFKVDDKHWYSIMQSTRLQAIDNYGKDGEKIYPIDEGPGYLWRSYNFTKYEQTEDGVYMELETIALSRDVPFFWRWIVNPMIERSARNYIHSFLEQTRTAVEASIKER